VCRDHARPERRRGSTRQRRTSTERFCNLRRRRRRGKVGSSRQVDETYVKVQGRWCYLYRAIDKSGASVDVRLSGTRDMATAKAFLRSARTVTGLTPARVTAAHTTATQGRSIPNSIAASRADASQ
jgi:transposase-like protein